MTRFRYRAISPEGEIVEGVLDAGDRSSAARRLRTMSLKPLALADGGRPGLMQALNREVHLGSSARLRLRRDFARDMGTLLAAGARMSEALAIIAEEKEELGTFAAKLERRVSAGEALSSAVEMAPNHFDAASVAVLRSGERSGRLPDALGQLAAMTDATLKLRSEIASSLAYPVALVLATFSALSLLIFFVLPSFEGLFGGADRDALPWLTTAVFGFGRAARESAPYLGVLVLCLVVIGLFLPLTRSGRRAIDAGILRLPVVGELAIGFRTARFSIVFGRLLAAGERTETALRLTADAMGSHLFAASLMAAADRVESGAALSDALRAINLFPDRAMRLMAIGERSGRVAEVCADIAEIFEEATRERTRRVLAAIPPVLTVGVGLAVALLVFAILTTLLSVNELAFQ